MEANIWFYTLSTIAQVMAAIIGLFAVFVVYKLGVLKTSIDTQRNFIVPRVFEYRKNIEVEKDFDYYVFVSDRELLEYFKELIKNENKRATSGYVIHQKFLEKLVQQKKEILNRLVYSLIFTALSMVLSLLGLLLTCSWCSFLSLTVIASIALLTIIYVAFNVYQISKL